MTIRVLIVEDERLAAEAHQHYVSQIEGFEVAGTTRSAGEAMRHLAGDDDVQLLLLDMHLPDGHGLGLLQRLRATGHMCDVIAVTAARDADVVRHAVAQGVVLYLIKPFTFAAFRAKLEQYADYRAQLGAQADDVAQHHVDQLLGTLRSSGTSTPLPKGMSSESLQQVTDVVRDSGAPLSASEVAALTGSSRVTARRYLEHLAEIGMVQRSPRYGSSGRPEVEYCWAPRG